MVIIYREDKDNITRLTLDEWGVTFEHGYARFGDKNGEDYEVPIDEIIAIRED